MNCNLLNTGYAAAFQNEPVIDARKLRQWAIELLVPYVASEVLIDAADEIVKFVENGKA